jgi:radical SAM superfamily enzyme YgiQ (UPF0313 family)
MSTDGKILFIFPKWPELTLWGHFKYNFPPLGLLTIAGLTPETFAVEFIDENVSDIDFHSDADLVALSVMTPLAHRAYEIADRFRADGKTVVMGGIHVSIHPEEAAAHADCVVCGEAEDVWPQLLADYRRGRLKARYRQENLINMGREFPVPRRDLLRQGCYITRSTIQMMRGCPFDCEFCSVTAFSGREFRARPVDAFVNEFRALPDRFVFVVDDNILSKKKVAEQLFEQMRDSGKWWGSQVTISVADDDALLKKMARAGCKSLFIGFESLDQNNLIDMGKKFVRAHKNEDRIKRIQDHGIGILGSFIVGLDGDDESVFEQQYEFITRTRLEAFLISVLTPFPGTHLTRRMEAEGRVLSKDWSKYDMSTVVFQPKNFTPERLQERYDELNRALYSLGSIAHRTLKPRKNMLIFVPQNFGFRNAWRGLERARLATEQ